jgi:hypothetical protein
MVIYIRDTFDSVREFNMSSIIVVPDTQVIIELLNMLQNPTDTLAIKSFVQLLISENQNIVAQIITSISQQLNQMSSESIENAASQGIPLTNVYVTSMTTTQSSEVESFLFIKILYLNIVK